MKKPTVKELKAYAAEIGWADFDAERFFDHYEMVGWVVGPRKPMKDWKAAVRTWRRNAREWGKPAGLTEAERRVAAATERRADMDRRREAEAAYLQEAVEQLAALRSWRGVERSPYDVAAEEPRLLAKWRDQHGPGFVKRVLDTQKARERAQKAGTAQDPSLRPERFCGGSRIPDGGFNDSTSNTEEP